MKIKIITKNMTYNDFYPVSEDIRKLGGMWNIDSMTLDSFYDGLSQESCDYLMLKYPDIVVRL